MLSPYTLENSENWGVQSAPMALEMHGQYKPFFDLQVPAGGKIVQRVFQTQMAPWANDRADIFAPGVRDQLPATGMTGESGVYLGPYRSNLYDISQARGTAANNAPIPNWNEDIPSNMQSRQNQRMGAEIWQILQETPNVLGLRWRDTGTFSVPYTGFTPFNQLRPHSTMRFI